MPVTMIGALDWSALDSSRVAAWLGQVSLRAGVLLCALFCCTNSGHAQDFHFPPTETDSLLVQAGFSARARSVIKFNACGRELDYAQYRSEQQANRYDNEGEGLGSILIAKIAWLADPDTRETACRLERKIERRISEQENPESFLEGVRAWQDPARPTPCARGVVQTSHDRDRIDAVFTVDPGCMRRQVNEGILAMRKTTDMGSSKLRCLESFEFGPSRGEFDVNVRELVRILYMGSPPRSNVLDADTRTHMWKELLAARGPLGDASYSQVTSCYQPAGDELGTPEEFADTHSFANELMESLSAPFRWLLDFLGRLAVGLTATGVSLASYPFMILAGEELPPLPIYDLRIPETENHRLMIESSRYLTNQAAIDYLSSIGYDNVDDIREYQPELREWLLKIMRNITKNDFDEYNSRPYTRYSLNAIMNLHDFAKDDALRTASRIVLDLSAAKFAAQQNRGRRMVPYRRLANNDGFSDNVHPQFLFNVFSGSDHEVVRAFVLYGQLQLQPFGPDTRGAGSMVNTAVSDYRPPLLVTRVAVERPRAFGERGRYETVYASPAFTMSLGGKKTPAVLNFLGNFDNENDRGIAMPSVIIPTATGTRVEDLYYFAGVGTAHERSDNTCGRKGFICGLNPHLSKAYEGCTIRRMVRGVEAAFVDSANCYQSKPFFYLVAHRHMMEIIEAPDAVPGDDAAFNAFVAGRVAALETPDPPGLAEGTEVYRTVAGERIHFHVTNENARILSVDQPVHYIGSDWIDFTDEILDTWSQGEYPYRGSLMCPWSGERIEYDFTDWNQPKIVP
jgi:hypothetical protein